MFELDEQTIAIMRAQGGPDFLWAPTYSFDQANRYLQECRQALGTFAQIEERLAAAADRRITIETTAISALRDQLKQAEDAIFSKDLEIQGLKARIEELQEGTP